MISSANYVDRHTTIKKEKNLGWRLQQPLRFTPITHLSFYVLVSFMNILKISNLGSFLSEQNFRNSLNT